MSEPADRQVVLVFDETGRRIAAGAGLDAAVPAEAIPATLDDLRLQRETAPDAVRVHRVVPEASGAPALVALVDLDAGHGPSDEELVRALGRVLAHELRTPLTTIYGGAQLVADPSVGGTVRDEAAQVVGREAQRLYDVVQDLVLLVRPDTAAVAHEPTLVQRVVARVVRSAEAAAEGVAISADAGPGLPPVIANEELLEHALRNFVGAAVRHAPDGSTVEVTATASPHHVTVRVRDEGAPLSEPEAEHAFDLFAETARTAGDPSGANLAAHVAARVVRAMGGRVRAVPLAEGLAVEVELPRGDASAP